MGFVNARPRPAVDFDADPNNPAASIVRDAMLRLHGGLVAVIGGGDVDPSNQYFGVGPQLQDFQGAANRSGTTVVTRDGDVPTIGSAIAAGPNTSPVMRVFADRLRRRSPM
jgi:hypothetical protein